jgi:hypothetical protein
MKPENPPLKTPVNPQQTPSRSRDRLSPEEIEELRRDSKRAMEIARQLIRAKKPG